MEASYQSWAPILALPCGPSACLAARSPEPGANRRAKLSGRGTHRLSHETPQGRRVAVPDLLGNLRH